MNGPSATSHEFLDALSPENQRRLAEALENCFERLERGETVDAAELAEKYPDLAEPLESYLGSLGFLHQASQELSPSQPSAPLSATGPRTLGDYEIVRELGRGGMGIVYEARQISLGRTVALKVLPFAAVLDQKQIARFANESRAAAQLHHPNIVPVYAVGNERGVYYYSMQYVEGQPLDVAIEQLRHNSAPSAQAGGEEASDDAVRRSTVAAAGTFSATRSIQNRQFLRTAVEMAIQAAHALQHAHDYGVIHRDIKPSNLLIDSSGKLWITDFGVARVQAESNMTKTGDMMGTLRYMSPEQSVGQWSQVDGRTDVYSLGITLYELLTLQPAFADDGKKPLAQRVAEDEPPAPRRHNAAIPVDLETIVLKAISKSRDQRYGTAQELADDLRRFLDDKPTLAKRPSLLDRAGKWARRHQTLVAAAAALLLVISSGLLVGNVLLSRQQHKTRQALARAEEHYRQARGAVDQLGAWRADRLAEIPGAEVVRRELLRETLHYYLQFIAQAGDDPSLRSDLASTYFKAGTIIEQIGSPTDAIESYRESEKLWMQLVESESDNPGHKNRLALCANNLGLLLAKSGRTDDALDAYRRAIELQQWLINEKPAEEDDPGNVEHSKNLALTYTNLGLLHHNVGNAELADDSYRRAIRIQRELADRHPHDDQLLGHLAVSYNNRSYMHSQSNPQFAEELYTSAIEIQEKLVAARPDNAAHRSDLALTCNNLGALQSQNGRYEAARSTYQRAIEIQQQLVRMSPAIVRHRRDLAVSHNNLARVCAELELPQQADESFSRARAILEELVSDYPAEPNFRSSLAGVLNNQGMALEQLRQLAEAAAVFAEAIDHQQRALATAPHVESFREFLSKHYYNQGRVLRALGRPQEAAEAALARAALWPDNPQKQYSAAGELAQAVAQMDAAGAGSVRRRYADAAVESLRQSIAAGFGDQNELARDEQFDSIKQHPGFQQLLRSVDGESPLSRSSGSAEQPTSEPAS